MEENDLTKSFETSLGADIAKFTGDAIEFGVDLCMDDGILKDIPFVGTAFKLYSIGSKVYDNHCMKKLYSFIFAINSGSCSKETQEKYRKKFIENEKFRKRELAYLLILIDRYIGFEKPQMLAKIYLAYLNDKISWIKLTQYAEVIDRFLPGDYSVLCSETHYKTENDKETDSIQRLIALGLIIEEIRKSNVQFDGNGTVMIDDPEIVRKKERTYMRTDFGDILVKIISEQGAVIL